MECQQHDDYQDSIRWLLNYIEEYAKHGKTATSGGGQSAQGIMSVSRVGISIFKSSRVYTGSSG